MKEIHNGHDIIDSRDVIARIAELERQLQAAHESARAEWTDDVARDDDNEPPADFDGWLDFVGDDDDDARELLTLRALAEQAQYYGDWSHGAALIADSYFTEYAEQMAEDIGAVKDSRTWPCDCIDWEKAADALKIDYTSIDFDGTTYWIRS